MALRFVRHRRLLFSVVGAVLIALVAGGVALAASGGPRAHRPGRWAGGRFPAARGWMFRHRLHQGAFGGRFLHGQVVLARPGGGYVLDEIQRGQVTAVDTRSGAQTVTVRSPDGFQVTYRVPATARIAAGPDGLAGVHRGDRVLVVASVASTRGPDGLRAVPGAQPSVVALRDRGLRPTGRGSFL